MATFPREILPHLCESLMAPDTKGPSDSQYQGLQTIQALARTCRDFHEHALNVLWHTIPSVALLAYTIPQDAWEAHEWGGKHTEDGDQPKDRLHVEIILRRPLVEQDFLRWNHYANRVLRILPHINCEWFPERVRYHEPSPSFMDALASFFPHPGSLLPNLGVYHVFHINAFGLYRSLHILFGPKLENFYHCCIHTPSQFDSEENDYTRMLVHLRERSPSLIALGLSAEPCSSQFAANVFRDLSHYRALTMVLLDAIPVTAPAILHLSTVKELEDIHLTLSPQLTEDAFDDVPPAAHFPALRHIYLNHETSLAVCTAVVRFVRSKFLHALQITCASPATATVADVRDFFLALTATPFQPAVNHIVLRVHALADPDVSPITNDTFAGLLRLTKVLAVDVDICHPFAIDDTLVAALASTFPTLTYLNLGTIRPWKGPPPVSVAVSARDGTQTTPAPIPTLRALVALAQHCPKLHTLGLTFDPRTADLDTSTRPGRGTEQTALRTLHIGRSPIAAPEPVAAFLSDIFSELLALRCAWARPDALEGEAAAAMDAEERAALEREVRCGKAWVSVEELVQVFVDVRAVERYWVERAREDSVLPWDSSTSESESDSDSDLSDPDYVVPGTSIMRF